MATTALQKLADTRSRIEKHDRQLDQLQRAETKRVIEAIFEALGIKVVVGLNYLDHHAKGVTVRRESQDTNMFLRVGFEVTAVVSGVVVTAWVHDEQSPKLVAFKAVLDNLNQK